MKNIVNKSFKPKFIKCKQKQIIMKKYKKNLYKILKNKNKKYKN